MRANWDVEAIKEVDEDQTQKKKDKKSQVYLKKHFFTWYLSFSDSFLTSWQEILLTMS